MKVHWKIFNIYNFFFDNSKLKKYSTERLLFLPPSEDEVVNKFLYTYMDYDKMKEAYREKCG